MNLNSPAGPVRSKNPDLSKVLDLDAAQILGQGWCQVAEEGEGCYKLHAAAWSDAESCSQGYIAIT